MFKKIEKLPNGDTIIYTVAPVKIGKIYCNVCQQLVYQLCHDPNGSAGRNDILGCPNIDVDNENETVV